MSNFPETSLKKLREKNYKIEFKSHFFEELFSKIQMNTWVDIENTYYSWILRIYKAQISNNNSELRIKLETLNRSFKELQNLLEKYLISISGNRKLDPISDIKKHFEKIIQSLSKSGPDKICAINFNYTDTLNVYLNNYNNIQKIQIHGKLNEPLNPIIFGYGDETDEEYKEIENMNDNEYLKFMKSFGYFKTNLYQNLIEFISDDFYCVHIMGHSCGLSDRVLLKRIFENVNCKKINIYYHAESDNKNDYINKCMNISRHFSSDRKDAMRVRITSEEYSLPLVSLIPNK